MAVEVTAVLRFSDAAAAAACLQDIEYEFDCDVVEWEDEEV